MSYLVVSDELGEGKGRGGGEGGGSGLEEALLL